MTLPDASSMIGSRGKSDTRSRICWRNASTELYEVEAWIAAGRSLTVPKDVRKGLKTGDSQDERSDDVRVVGTEDRCNGVNLARPERGRDAHSTCTLTSADCTIGGDRQASDHL